MTEIAQAVVALSGVWLLFVAGFMVLRPHAAIRALAAMGSTPLIHYGEHALRFLAGAAFVLAAPASKAPLAFQVFGGFLAVSSVLIALAPRRWHARYAKYWAATLRPWMIRCLAPLSAVAGCAVIWAAI